MTMPTELTVTGEVNFTTEDICDYLCVNTPIGERAMYVRMDTHLLPPMDIAKFELAVVEHREEVQRYKEQILQSRQRWKRFRLFGQHMKAAFAALFGRD